MIDFGKYIKVGPKVTPGTPKRQPDEIARGDAWYVRELERGPVLFVLTGENPEREEQIDLTPTEVVRLKAGELTGADILRARFNDARGR